MAFKEWAVVCDALAAGRQAVIVRKGGIAEDGGKFRPEHPRFWLYPTYLHQQQGGVKPGLPVPMRPPEGLLRLSHFAEVAAVHFVRSLDAALALDDLHVWTADTIRQRFHYRTPGLYVLPVRVYRVLPTEIVERPEYAGCKTWVELADELSTTGAEPVLTDAEFRGFVEKFGRLV